MGKEIVNKIANSKLITIDLNDYVPKIDILQFDIADLLFEGIILKEKDFRSKIKAFDFTNFNKKNATIMCSADVIIPMWAYMLVATFLNPLCSRLFFGSKEEIIQNITLENINAIDEKKFLNKKVIVKGCGNIANSEHCYVAITKKMQKSVKVLLFGEACSAVPVYKKKIL